MTDPRCERLDEYLCGWLPPDEAADFEAHLAGCPVCQEESAVQRHIDGVLAEGSAQVEPVPIRLAGRIERGVRVARRRRQLGWACTLTAAAGIFLVFGLWGVPTVFFPRDDGRATAPTPIAVHTAEPSSLQSVATVRVSLVDPSSAILVPIESHSPNVTLVRVYPTTRVDWEDERQPPP